MVKLLLENKADIHAKITYDGTTPLILAVLNGHSAITRVLVEENANLQATDTIKHNTALHIACEKSFKDIVQILATETTYHALFNLKNKEDKSPFDISEEKAIEFSAMQINESSK